MARSQFKGNTDRLIELSLMITVVIWLWQHINTAMEVAYFAVVGILILFLCWVWRKAAE